MTRTDQPVKTMSNPPAEITTPPEGYEWAGEFREPKWGSEPYGEWRGEWAVAYGQGFEMDGTRKPILRKIKPPTVIIELDREDAEFFKDHPSTTGSHAALALACHKALEKENAN